MTMYQLPVTSQPNQTFTTSIPLGGNTLRLKLFLQWNLCTSTWEASVWVNDTELIMSHIPLMTGNITGYLDYKNYGYLKVIGNSGKPNLENLGSIYSLVWVTP